MRFVTALLAAAPVGCTHKLTPPPALFPVTTAWKATLSALIDPPLGSDDTRLFVATRDGNVQAFRLADGKLLWTTGTGAGQIGVGPGIIVLRADDGRVSRLDPETGKLSWQAESGIAGRIPPLIDGGLVLVGGAGLAALSSVDGHKLWTATDGADVTAPPVASGARLFVGEEDGTLRCRDRATGASLWTFKTRSALSAPVVIDDGPRALFGTSEGHFVAVSAEKGKRQWQWKIGAAVQQRAALLKDTVLFASFEDVLYSLDRRNGHMRWRVVLPSRPLSSPILTGAAVVVACHDDNVVGFDARSGRRLGALITPAEIRTPPIVVADRLYIGLRDRSVVALALDQTPAKEEPLQPKKPGQPGAQAGQDRSRDPVP
jgi:outer membrane protein assembly factor BamB